MIMFLEETKLFNSNISFNVLIENKYFGDLFLENKTFLDVKFTKNKKKDFEILKNISDQHEDLLKLKVIGKHSKIYQITWQDKTKKTNDFYTYNLIEDITTFKKQKHKYEKFFNVDFVLITEIKFDLIYKNTYNDFNELTISILNKQKEVKNPNILYFMFSDILNEDFLNTLDRIGFL